MSLRRHGKWRMALPRQAILVAVEHFLADGEPLGSFFIHAWAHGSVDHAAGPRTLERGRRLDAEEAEALHEPHVSAQGCCFDAEGAEALCEPHRPQLGAGEAARGMVQGSPPQR